MQLQLQIVFPSEAIISAGLENLFGHDIFTQLRKKWRTR